MGTDTAASVTVLEGDARERLASLPDNSVGTIVTDPPYELDFTRLGGPGWDRTGVAFDQDLWREALRVLKPGGNLAAFGHSRTYHRLACAIEDAGFELRDSITVWMYGQGHPKRGNVAAELTKAGRDELAGAATGFHSQLRPAYEPIVLARKPLAGGTLAANWGAFGLGGLNIDATRIPTDEDLSRTPGDTAAATWRIQRGTARSTPNPGGRFTPNVWVCHLPECRDGSACEAGCAVAEVRRQGLESRGRGEDAARFVPTFYWGPKAPKSERPTVDGVSHSTVKPMRLIRQLVELCAAPGHTVLDPFAGSGTTLEVCVELGFDVIGIELEPKHVPLIHQRIARASVAGGREAA